MSTKRGCRTEHTRWSWNVHFRESSLGPADGVLSRIQERNSRRISESLRSRNSPVLVQTPDVPILPHEADREIKVFNLIADAVRRKIAPWKTIDCWGFNGASPNPAIQANKGDRVRVILENRW